MLLLCSIRFLDEVVLGMSEPLARDDDALNLSGSLVNLKRKNERHPFPRTDHSSFFTERKKCLRKNKILHNSVTHLVDLSVAHEFLNGVLGVESVASKDLDGVGGTLVGHVTGQGLGDRGQVRVAGTLIGLPAGLHVAKTSGLKTCSRKKTINHLFFPGSI